MKWKDPAAKDDSAASDSFEAEAGSLACLVHCRMPGSSTASTTVGPQCKFVTESMGHGNHEY